MKTPLIAQNDPILYDNIQENVQYGLHTNNLTLPIKVDGDFSPFPTVVRAINPHQKLSKNVHFFTPSFSAKYIKLKNPI